MQRVWETAYTIHVPRSWRSNQIAVNVWHHRVYIAHIAQNINIADGCSTVIVHRCGTMEVSIDEASKRLGFSFLNSQQMRAITKFLEGNDVFVGLHIGSGKSLCFALLPFTFDDFLGKEGSIAIVSSLISLIKDQVGYQISLSSLFLQIISDTLYTKITLIKFCPVCNWHTDYNGCVSYSIQYDH